MILLLYPLEEDCDIDRVPDFGEVSLPDLVRFVCLSDSLLEADDDDDDVNFISDVDLPDLFSVLLRNV